MRARCLRTATDLVTSQMAEQILPDGAHFELSSSYHIEFMRDLVKLRQLLDPSVRERIADHKAPRG